MKTFFAIISILALVLVAPAMAAKKGKGPHPAETPDAKIVEVNALSIKVTLGKSGDEHAEYKINDQTKITLNGVPVAARDLRAGMVAHIEIGPDKTTATTITVKDAPAHPDKHRVG